MIQSTTYLDSVANGELVPQITLSPLANPDEEWTTLEMGDILMKQSNQIFGIGDHNGVSCHTLFYPFCNVNIIKTCKFQNITIISSFSVRQYQSWFMAHGKQGRPNVYGSN